MAMLVGYFAKNSNLQSSTAKAKKHFKYRVLLEVVQPLVLAYEALRSLSGSILIPPQAINIKAPGF